MLECSTHTQRDVRQVLQVADLEVFATFVRLAAGRTGTEINLSGLGADTGIRRVHLGLEPRLYHYRGAQGLGVDLAVDLGSRIVLGEVKAGATVNQEFFRDLRRLREALHQAESGGEVFPRLIYGGDHGQSRTDIEVVPWAGITDLAWE